MGLGIIPVGLLGSLRNVFMATDVLLLCLIHIIGKVQQYYVEIMLGGAIDGIYLD